MQTRKSNRQAISLLGRYVTGFGTVCDVTMADLSPGGCRFESDNDQLMIGSALKIYFGEMGPYRATVKWVADGQVGITFANRLTDQQFDHLQHGGDACAASADGPHLLPHRFV